ncbi:hypothetical protein LMG28614_03327 [Paraburkholderia ultramafica]|uniref:DUF3106 domain-containing protein n=1 Tax=Paraburkholderia ultramafica TaxID=1544867 RepID=A0A6S7CYQ7_9BURK|nr:DUF3106 domain-containing protein [Paraburkholderia ultramafica]CAB3791486.1 hypothetical protein LMG28614_03327 [Paraburkholderia ultramafica]
MSYKRGLAVVFGCTIAALVSFAATYPRFYPSPSPAGAPSAGGNATAKPPAPTLAVELPGLPGSNSPLAWSRLTSAEHLALAPFEAQWDSFSDERKRKWIKIALRYPKMSPDAQKRLHDRMSEWVRMTPDQRRVARENYQVSKELPREARQNAWKAYQQLPEEQKERLAASERKRRPSVVSAPPSARNEIKGLERIVNAREHGASGVAAASAAALPGPAAPPAIPAAGSFVPATPVPVSPAEAPSIFNGS